MEKEMLEDSKENGQAQWPNRCWWGGGGM